MQFGRKCKFQPIGSTLTALLLSTAAPDPAIATELYGSQSIPVKHSKADRSVIEIDPAKLLPHWRPYFPALASARHNEIPTGEVIQIAGFEVDALGDEASTLRALYNKGNVELLAKGRAMLKAGKAEEEVARWIVNARNDLKVTIRSQGNEIFRKYVEWCSQKEYKNPVGPSYEQRVARLSGKVPREKINITIIENVTDTNKVFNVSGKVMKGIGKVSEGVGFVIMATQDSPATDTPLPKTTEEEIEIEKVRLRLGIPVTANIDRHGHLKPAFYMQVDVLDPHAADEFEAESDEILWWLGIPLTYRYGGVQWTVPGR